MGQRLQGWRQHEWPTFAWPSRQTSLISKVLHKGDVFVFPHLPSPHPPSCHLISKVLYKGDVFVFPQGLIHFQLNVGTTDAVAIAALGSQNPGVITIAKAVFGSKPPISVDVLTKAFQVEKDVVAYLQSQFWTDNHAY